MEARLKTILVLSLAGGVLTLLLLAAKPLTRRLFGSRWQYYIWLLVLVVMVLPVRIPLPIGAPVTVTLQQQEPVQLPAEQPEMAEPAAAPQAAPETPADQQPPAPNPLLENGKVGVANGISFNLFWFVGAVWLAGCLVFLGQGIVSYIRFLHIIRKHASDADCPALADVCTELRIRTPIRVKTTDMLDAPMLTGVFRPVLLLPRRDIGEKELQFILLHELTHYRRRDLWYKWFAFFVNALHWFNPLIYLTVRQINEECEISCDLAVTAHMSEEDKAGYMGTILALAARQQKEGKS